MRLLHKAVMTSKTLTQLLWKVGDLPYLHSLLPFRMVLYRHSYENHCRVLPRYYSWDLSSLKRESRTSHWANNVLSLHYFSSPKVYVFASLIRTLVTAPHVRTTGCQSIIQSVRPPSPIELHTVHISATKGLLVEP